MGLDSASARRRSRRFNFIGRGVRTAGPKRQTRHGDGSPGGFLETLSGRLPAQRRRRCRICGEETLLTRQEFGPLQLRQPRHMFTASLSPLFMFYVKILIQPSASSVFAFINRWEQICSICGASWELFYEGSNKGCQSQGS